VVVQMKKVDVDKLNFEIKARVGPIIHTTHRKTGEPAVDKFRYYAWVCEDPEIVVYDLGWERTGDWLVDPAKFFILQMHDLSISFATPSDRVRRLEEDGTHVWLIDDIGMSVSRWGPSSGQPYSSITRHGKFRSKEEMEQGIAIFKKAISTFKWRAWAKVDGKVIDYPHKECDADVEFTDRLQQKIKNLEVVKWQDSANTA